MFRLELFYFVLTMFTVNAASVSRLRSVPDTQMVSNKLLNRDLALFDEVTELLHEETKSMFSNPSLAMSFPVWDNDDDPFCATAYVYCGDISTCSPENLLWEIDTADLFMDSTFPISCEVRVGSGQCTMTPSVDESETTEQYIGIGTFEITKDTIEASLTDGLNGFDVSLLGFDSLDIPLESSFNSTLVATTTNNSLGSSFTVVLSSDRFTVIAGASIKFLSIYVTFCNFNAIQGELEDDMGTTATQYPTPSGALTDNPDDDLDYVSHYPTPSWDLIENLDDDLDYVSPTVSLNYVPTVTPVTHPTVPVNALPTAVQSPTSTVSLPALSSIPSGVMGTISTIPSDLATNNSLTAAPSLLAFDPVVPIFDDSKTSHSGTTVSPPPRFGSIFLGSIVVLPAAVLVAFGAVYVAFRRRPKHTTTCTGGAFHFDLTRLGNDV